MARKHYRKSKPKTQTQRAKGINQSLNDDERAIAKNFEQDSKFEKKTDASSGRRGSSKSVPRTKYGNDPVWYALNPQLLQDAGALSFNNPIGLTVPDVLVRGNTNPAMVVPGIATIDYIPGVGISTNNASAVNVAARRLYTFIRHANAGSANYDSPDLMLYCMAVASAYTTYMQLVRAYGIANVYSQKNRYMPNALLQALGFDPLEVQRNLADFRYQIGVFSAKLNSLAVPSSLSYFKRHAWLVTGVFLDNPGTKSQIYAFKPEGYFEYVETNAGVPGYLDYKKYGTTLASWVKSSQEAKTISLAAWYYIMNSQIAKLLESEDIGIMAGDILKAYGAENLLNVPSVAEDYVVIPQYDEEVLLQISNAKLVGFGYEVLESCRVTQNSETGALIYNPEIKFESNLVSFFPITRNYLNARALMSVRSESPTPADVMIASRFMVSSAVGNTTSDGFTILGAGTEIPRQFMIYKFDYSGDGPKLMSYPLGAVSVAATDPESINFYMGVVPDISKFDWHPQIPLFVRPTADPQHNLVGYIGDLDNYTTVGYSELRKLHETALLSMFNVPDLNKTFK